MLNIVVFEYMGLWLIFVKFFIFGIVVFLFYNLKIECKGVILKSKVIV